MINEEEVGKLSSSIREQPIEQFQCSCKTSWLMNVRKSNHPLSFYLKIKIKFLTLLIFEKMQPFGFPGGNPMVGQSK